MTTDTTKLREMRGAAMSGEWYVKEASLDGYYYIANDKAGVAFLIDNKRYATYIVALHNALPDLLNELDGLRKEKRIHDLRRGVPVCDIEGLVP